MGENDIYLTDKEVCAALKISPRTLSRILNGFKRGEMHTVLGKRVDLSKSNPLLIGGYRRWDIRRLAEVLDVPCVDLRNF